MRILHIIVGSRGAIPQSTINGLKELRIVERKHLKTLAMIALRSSIEMANAHIDY